jgi:hypothetical protein
MEILIGAFLIAVVVVVAMLGGLVHLFKRQGGFRLAEGDEGSRLKSGYHRHSQSDFL